MFARLLKNGAEAAADKLIAEANETQILIGPTKEQLKSCGLSYADIARAIGYSRESVRNYIRGTAGKAVVEAMTLWWCTGHHAPPAPPARRHAPPAPCAPPADVDELLRLSGLAERKRHRKLLRRAAQYLAR